MQVRTRALRTAGIRRCGQRHTAEPRTWPSGTYTDEEVRILLSDPDLVTEVLEQSDELVSKTVAELRAIAAESGIIVENIEGSGRNGAVIKDDLVRVIRGLDDLVEQSAGLRLVVGAGGAPEITPETPGAQNPEGSAEGGE